MPSLARVATTAVFLLSTGAGTAAPQPTARVPQRTTPGYTYGRPQQTLTQATSPPAGLHAHRPAVGARYEVGAYYFSGWSHSSNNNITAVLTGTWRASEPLIGWYDDSQRPVDATITQAADAGITFFAFDWYDLARSPYRTDRTLNEALGYYLTSPQRHRLRFCLTLVNFPPFTPQAAEWPALTTYWVTHYFGRPEYERIGGKPLFIVFSPELMRSTFGGSAGVRRALALLRTRARAAGLPGVTVAVAATIAPFYNPIQVRALNAEGYDIATGYNYHATGGEQYRVPVPYERLVSENVAMWNRVARLLQLPYMPVITSGWDQRYSAREQQTAIIYEGRTPAKFACFAVQARHWIDTHHRQTPRERFVMIFAWNEIGEGGAIIPDHRDGFAYARAVRLVFGGPGRTPATPPYCH